MFKRNFFISCLLLVAFFLQSLGITAHAQEPLNLPAPGSMMDVSLAFTPVLVKGLKVHPENPLLFDFILDTGNSKLTTNGPQFKTESEKLIKYFLAALTLPENDLWVNLSPYEKDRIVPDELGQTELGRDMLAQDYILKQLTASMIYPEKQLGKEFWNRVYTKAQQLFGTTVDVPVNTFNKVWIVADKAKVLERNNAAFVVGAHLKVMLEEDYLATMKNIDRRGMIHHAQSEKGLINQTPTGTNQTASQIIREIVLPELEKEVNQGQNFAPLRQMFYSMILASWYKLALKDAFLNQVYSNKAKTSGVLSDDPKDKERIYEQYLKAYKKGVFNYIKEDISNNVGDDHDRPVTVPRKYFSGGLKLLQRPVERESKLGIGESSAMAAQGSMAMVTVAIDRSSKNYAMSKSEVVTHLIAVAVLVWAIYEFSKLRKAKKKENDLLKKDESSSRNNKTIISKERVLLEINEVLDQKQLTPDIVASINALSKHMSQFGIDFVPRSKDFMRVSILEEPNIKIMHAATREIVESVDFDDYEEIADQVYHIGWTGLDKQRHGFWLVFPKEDEGFEVPEELSFAMASAAEKPAGAQSAAMLTVKDIRKTVIKWLGKYSTDVDKDYKVKVEKTKEEGVTEVTIGQKIEVGSNGLMSLVIKRIFDKYGELEKEFESSNRVSVTFAPSAFDNPYRIKFLINEETESQRSERLRRQAAIFKRLADGESIYAIADSAMMAEEFNNEMSELINGYGSAPLIDVTHDVITDNFIKALLEWFEKHRFVIRNKKRFIEGLQFNLKEKPGDSLQFKVDGFLYRQLQGSEEGTLTLMTKGGSGNWIWNPLTKWNFVNLLTALIALDSSSAMNTADKKLSIEEVRALTPQFKSLEIFLAQLSQWRKEHPNARLVFINRHGESTSNILHQTQSNEGYSPLTRRGLEQAEGLKVFLKDKIQFDRFLSSDLERAFETIRLLAEAQGRTIETIKALREVLLFPIGGADLEQMLSFLPENWTAFLNDPLSFGITKADAIAVQRQGLINLFNDIIREKDLNIAISTHGMTIDLILMELFGIDYKKINSVFTQLEAVNNVAVTVVAYEPKDGKWQLLVKPDNNYLDERIRKRTVQSADIARERGRYLAIARQRLQGGALGNVNQLNDYLPNREILEGVSDARLGEMITNFNARVAKEEGSQAAMASAAGETPKAPSAAMAGRFSDATVEKVLRILDEWADELLLDKEELPLYRDFVLQMLRGQITRRQVLNRDSEFGVNKYKFDAVLISLLLTAREGFDYYETRQIFDFLYLPQAHDPLSFAAKEISRTSDRKISLERSLEILQEAKRMKDSPDLEMEDSPAMATAARETPKAPSAAMMSIEQVKLTIKDKKFLIVDDDPSVLMALKRTLKSFGVVEGNIIQASNGKEALEKLAQGGIDAVISDMNMPGMDGYQLAKHMKDSNTKIPIVVVSGRAEDYVSEFRQLGVPLLSKPCENLVLMGKIAEMINANAAMNGPGGIDLNAKHMGLDVTKEGQGIQMKFDPAMLAEFQKGDFTGVVPIILRITPLTSVLSILGLSENLI